MTDEVRSKVLAMLNAGDYKWASDDPDEEDVDLLAVGGAMSYLEEASP